MKNIFANFWPTIVVIVLALGLLMYALREKPSSITENTVTTEVSRVEVEAYRGRLFVWRAQPDSGQSIGAIDSIALGLTDGREMIVGFEDMENK